MRYIKQKNDVVVLSMCKSVNDIIYSSQKLNVNITQENITKIVLNNYLGIDFDKTIEDCKLISKNVVSVSDKALKKRKTVCKKKK